MKRLHKIMTSLLAVGGMLLPTMAQAQAPNRILMVDTNGDYQSFVIAYEDQATFMNIPGPVLAEVEIFDVKLTEMTVTILRTPSCASFSIGILPAAVADEMTDLSVINYIQEDNPGRYYQDFITDPDDPETAARIEGISLDPNTEYMVLTVGYDDWGIQSGVGRYPFTTPGGATRISAADLAGKVLASDGRVFELPATPTLNLK